MKEQKYTLSMNGDSPETLGPEWLALVLVVGGNVGVALNELGLDPKDLHIAVTTPEGKRVCLHWSSGESPTGCAS